MVGYVSKDEGKSHHRTHAKNVTRAEISSSLAEYRTLQRAVVTEHRTELGKKNFYGLLRRYKLENFGGIEPSILLLTTWYIQAGLAMPAPSWVVPTGGYGMCPERSQAFVVAMMTPELFTRAHCYVLFWSGGQGGRATTSMELWDAMDCEFAGMTHEQAKQCSHNRLQVAGQLDHARAKTALDKAAASVASGAVPRLSQDSSDSEGESGHDAEQRRRPARRSLDEMVRSENDMTEESSDLPLIVHPKCTDQGCTRAGTYGMVQCDLCQGDIHRSCGIFADEDDSESVGFQGQRCRTCAQTRNGKGKSNA